MLRNHQYQLTIQWTGNKGSGTSQYREYERSYAILTPNKPTLTGSSDPAFRGDKTKHNPEDFFVASIASCHMLWYLHLCAEAGVIVVDYQDHATGIMQETSDGGGHFTQVTLHPRVKVSDTAMVSKANELHQEAHKRCFVANSCNFPIYHQPICVTQDAGN